MRQMIRKQYFSCLPSTTIARQSTLPLARPFKITGQIATSGLSLKQQNIYIPHFPSLFSAEQC